MGHAYWFLGSRQAVLADASQTGGRYDLLEFRIPPGRQTALHVHTAYSEQIYLTEGELTVWAGDRQVALKPGDSHLIPIGVAHALEATGPVEARGVVISSPSGFARLVEGSGTIDDGSGPPTAPPDLELFGRLAASVGDRVLGPPGTLPGDRPSPTA